LLLPLLLHTLFILLPPQKYLFEPRTHEGRIQTTVIELYAIGGKSFQVINLPGTT
jgi:hypothetical protein